MTNKDFIEIHKDKPPLKKLELFAKTMLILMDDTVERYRAVNCGGSAEIIRYMNSECEAMRERASWLYGEIEKALSTEEQRKAVKWE